MSDDGAGSEIFRCEGGDSVFRRRRFLDFDLRAIDKPTVADELQLARGSPGGVHSLTGSGRHLPEKPGLEPACGNLPQTTDCGTMDATL